MPFTLARCRIGVLRPARCGRIPKSRNFSLAGPLQEGFFPSLSPLQGGRRTPKPTTAMQVPAGTVPTGEMCARAVRSRGSCVARGARRLRRPRVRHTKGPFSSDCSCLQSCAETRKAFPCALVCFAGRTSVRQPGTFLWVSPLQGLPFGRWTRVFPALCQSRRASAVVRRLRGLSTHAAGKWENERLVGLNSPCAVHRALALRACARCAPRTFGRLLDWSSFGTGGGARWHGNSKEPDSVCHPRVATLILFRARVRVRAGRGEPNDEPSFFSTRACAWERVFQGLLTGGVWQTLCLPGVHFTPQYAQRQELEPYPCGPPVAGDAGPHFGSGVFRWTNAGHRARRRERLSLAP